MHHIFKEEPIRKDSVFYKVSEFKNKVGREFQKPYLITIVVSLIFLFFVLMFTFNIFYNKRTDLEIIKDENGEEFGIEVTRYFRTIEEIGINKDGSINQRVFIDLWYAPIAKIFVGISVPVIGYAIQIVTQNRLSSPSTLGFTPVAILSYITMLLVSPERTWLIYIFGFIFCGVIIIINWLLQRQKSMNRSFKPVLIGFAISATITAIGIVISVVKPSIVTASTIWTGELKDQPNWTKLYIGIPIIMISLLVIFILAPKLKIMQRDFVLARSLGINTNAIFWTITVLAGVITVTTVSITAPIILLGLIIPNIVRAVFNKHTPAFVFSVSMIFTLALIEVSLFLTVNFSFGANFLMAIISAFVLIFVMRKRS